MDAHKNFATSLVAVAPVPAASGLALTVTTAQGTRFPAASFNAVVCPAGTQATPANAEVVRVTAIATDVFTITRAQEGSSARTIVVGDQIYAGVTAKTLTDVEGDLISETLVDAKGDLIVATGADTPARKAVGTDGEALTADSTQADGLTWRAQPRVIRKSADETVNNSSTLQNDDHLLAAVVANSTYAFELWLFVSATSATPDWLLGWTVPASTTMLWGGMNVWGQFTGWGLQAVGGTAAVPFQTEAETAAFGGLVGNHGIMLGGVIRVAGTAGNVQFRWAQNTANATDSKVLADSHLLLRRLA